MMYYGMIVTATVLFSLQFVFNGGYERECGSGWPVARNFALITGVIGGVYAFALNGFRWEFSWFSLALAAASAINNLLYTYSSIKALAVANLSLYSMFAMLGGMILPYLFGLCRGEDFQWTGLVCCLLIAASLLLTVKKGESRKGALKYYLTVFITNGLSGVISVIHQSGKNAVSGNAYVMLSRIVIVAVCLVFLLADKNRTFRHSGKALAFATGYSLFATTGNVLLLLALLHIPATVQYPIVTGGVIVLSAVVDRLRRETVTKKTWLAVGIAFAASVVIAL